MRSDAGGPRGVPSRSLEKGLPQTSVSGAGLDREISGRLNPDREASEPAGPDGCAEYRSTVGRAPRGGVAHDKSTAGGAAFDDAARDRTVAGRASMSQISEKQTVGDRANCDWTNRDRTNRDWTNRDWAKRDRANRDWANRDWANTDWAVRDRAARTRARADRSAAILSIRAPRASDQTARAETGMTVETGVLHKTVRQAPTDAPTPPTRWDQRDRPPPEGGAAKALLSPAPTRHRTLCHPAGTHLPVQPLIVPSPDTPALAVHTARTLAPTARPLQRTAGEPRHKTSLPGQPVTQLTEHAHKGAAPCPKHGAHPVSHPQPCRRQSDTPGHPSDETAPQHNRATLAARAPKAPSHTAFLHLRRHQPDAPVPASNVSAPQHNHATLAARAPTAPSRTPPLQPRRDARA